MGPHANRLDPGHSFAWHDRAWCRGEDLALFFGRDGETGPERVRREREAKKVCQGCPVRSDCLEDALREPGQYGVWAGTDPEERKSLRRARQRQARAA